MQQEYLSAAVSLGLLKQALSEQPIIEEHISLFAKGLNTLQQCSNAEAEQLLGIKAIFPNGVEDLNQEEIDCVKAYLTNDYKKFHKLADKSNNNFEKIIHVFSPTVAQDVIDWMNKENSIRENQTNIQIELAKDDLADSLILKKFLFFPIHFDIECGLNNELTIGEQLIAHAFETKDPPLLKEIYVALKKQNIMLNNEMLQKISNTFKEPKEAAEWINLELVSIDPTQAASNELQQGITGNPDINLACFSNKELQINAISHYINPNTKEQFQLTMIEHVLAYAYNIRVSNPQKSMDLLHILQENWGITFQMIENVANTYQDSEQVIDSVNQVLVDINPTHAIQNELQRTVQANPVTIIKALSSDRINLGEIIDNSEVNLAELLITHAYNVNSSELFQLIYDALEKQNIDLNLHIN